MLNRLNGLSKTDKKKLIKDALEQVNYNTKNAVEIINLQGYTVTARTIRNYKKIIRSDVPKISELPILKINLNNKAKDIDPLKVLENLENRKSYLNSDVKKDTTDIHIKTKELIAIMLGSDFHFGGLDVDYTSLKKHVEFLFNTPRFYMITAGDDINLMTMMNRNVSARSEALTIEEQVAYLEALINKAVTEKKILACGWGNHDDEWFETNAGFSIIKFLTRNKVPYFEGQAYINLKVGSQYYPIMFSHKTRFNSYMNPVHGNKRMQQMQTELFGTELKPARIILTAHTHNPYYAVEGCLPEDRVILVKTGTFKTKDLYARRYFTPGKIGVPTLVLDPNTLNHQIFPTPWDAHQYMNGK